MGKPMHKPSLSVLAGKSRTPTVGGTKAGNGSKNRDPAKWLHHSLRTIHKALKQAKSFEIRKITRRLSQARKEAADAAKATGPNAISKLEQQLQAAKQADLDMLAQQAAAKAGLVVSSNSNNPATAAIAAAGLNGSTLASAVHQRLVSASCVQKQVTEQRNEFKRRFGDLYLQQQQQQQQQRPQHPAAAAAATAAADAGVDATAYSDDKETAAMAALEHGSKRQKRSLTAANASRPVSGHVSVVAGPSSSDDSGVMAADLHSLSDDDPTNSKSISKAESEDEGSSGSSSIDLEAEYAAQLHQADVDQPDQPPDDSELDDATLAALDKLRNRSTAAAAAAAAPDCDSGSDDSGVITDTDDASMSDTDSDQQQQQQQQGDRQDSKQQRQQQQPGDAVKYPPPPQLSKVEKVQLKKRQKLEKLLKSGKRLGQRMRRRLYEKLYGQDANHLKVFSQQGRRSNCTNRVQPAAGNQAGNVSRGSISKERQQQRAANPQHYQQRDSRMPDSEKQKQPQDLHPSWAARKQQKQVSGVAAAAAAKKVVFGDDGETVVGVHAPAQQQLHSKPSQQELPLKHQQLPHKQHKSPGQQQQQGQLSVGQKPSHSKQRHGSAPQPGGGVTRTVKSSGIPEKASDKLHPSWQAKKHQQTVLVAQPTGKRTIFEDD